MIAADDDFRRLLRINRADQQPTQDRSKVNVILY